jgi:hypothetical protein
MGRKFFLLLGLAIGYAMGTQASPQQRARVSGLLNRVRQDPMAAPSAMSSMADPLRPTG